jgi:hypothetical protein
LAALIILPILIVGVVIEFSEKRADRRRVGDLPDQARNFHYGKVAWEASREEFSPLYDETKRTLRALPPAANELEK